LKLQTKLIAEREELIIEQEAVLGGEERELTDDEKKRDNDINARVGEIDKQLDVIKRREANASSQKNYTEWMKDSQPKPAPKVTVTPAAEADTKKRGFSHSQEFLQIVLAAYQTGRMDDRLKPLQMRAAAGSDEAMVISDPYGGFMVPTAFSPQLLMIRPESDPIGALTTRVPMANAIVKMPVRVDKDHSASVAGGLTVVRKVETAAATTSRMTLSQVTLEAFSLFGLSYATEELLSDSPISWTAIIEQGFSDAFAGKILDERINGSGNGEFTGILKSGGLVTIAKESSQTADTFKFANLAKMMARCWGYEKAVWTYNHDCLPQLMEIADGDGRRIWQPSVREGKPNTIFGRPAMTCEYCQTVGDKGDILLVNWAEYLEGLLQPMQGAESIHVRFVEHERAFKFWIRNAGVPWWTSALTPAKSSNTLSPYVTLAERA
jgi:HK97 family phage major capsid protein